MSDTQAPMLELQRDREANEMGHLLVTPVIRLVGTLPLDKRLPFAYLAWDEGQEYYQHYRQGKPMKSKSRPKTICVMLTSDMAYIASSGKKGHRDPEQPPTQLKRWS